MTTQPDGTLDVVGLSADEIGATAADASVVLHQLADQRVSLEQAFMDLTEHSVEYHGSTTTLSTNPETKAA